MLLWPSLRLPFLSQREPAHAYNYSQRQSMISLIQSPCLWHRREQGRF